MDKNNVDTAKELPTVISFCSGYGGIERGLDLAGVKHRVLAYVEIEAFAIANLVAKMEWVSWFQRLSSRILKPSQRTSFETALTLLLEDTRASRFQQQGSALAPKTPDTSGPTSSTTSMQLDLFDASLKTSRDTSALDSEKSLATWKAQVTTQRGAYSARLKSAHRIRESGSILWRTPSAQESGITIDRLQTKDGQPPSLGERMYDKVTGRTAQYGLSQQVAVVQTWLTPRASDTGRGEKNETFTKRMGDRTGNVYQSLPSQVHAREAKHNLWPTSWATPRTTDAQGGGSPLNEKGRRITLSDPTKTYGGKLSDQVRHWPTPAARDYKGRSGAGRQERRGNPSDTLPNAVGNYLIPTVGDKNKVGHLNPDWVEWLMGVPTGWTDLGSWATA
jgi:hypothetical protein